MSNKQQLIEHCTKVIDKSTDHRKILEHAILYHLLNGVPLSDIFDEEGNLYDNRYLLDVQSK